MARFLYLLFFALNFVSFTSVAYADPVTIYPGRQDTDDFGPQNDLRSQISASFSVNFNVGRQVINLTEQDPNSRTLVVGDFRDGFQVVDSYEVGAGIGPAMSFWFNNATGVRSHIQGSIGLIPSIGKSVSATRSVPDRASVAKLKRFNSAPTKAEDLIGWADGDSISFSSTGGIEFGAAITSGIAIATASVSLTGEFQTNVEKIEENLFLVDLSATKVKRALASVGLSYAALAISKAKSLTRGLTFHVDISTEEGKRAYEDLVRGNVYTIQEMAREGKIASVRPREKYTIPQTAKYKSFSIGIPLLFELSWSSGKLHKVNDTMHLYDGSSIQTNYGIFVKDSESNILRDKSSKAKGFYGVAFQTRSAQGEAGTGKFGQFNWTYVSNKSSSKELRRAIQSVIRKTGLRDELKMEVPEGAKGTNQVSLALDLSDEQTDKLMALVSSSTKDDFTELATKLHSDYFANGDVDGLCREEEETALADCIDRLESQARSGTKDMFKALKIMAIARAAGDDAGFTDAYAKFGRGMIRNQFSFQAALALAGGAASVEYWIKGTNISSFHRSFVTATK